MTDIILKSRPIGKEAEFPYHVDIVIPFHGQYDKVTELLESIFKFTRSNFYTVYLVDDCSPNRNFSKQQESTVAKTHPGVLKVIRTPEHSGYSASCQLGYRAGESSYVCFMHSDCVVRDMGWLSKMGTSLMNFKSQNVRMVGPKTNNPMHAYDSKFQLGQLGDPTDDLIVPGDDFLATFCFMVHRELFSRCGGFLMPYPYAYYEDEEFAGRLRKYGFRQGVAGSVWIEHSGGATIRSVLRKDPNKRKIMEEGNRTRCVEDLKKLRSK